MEITACPNCGSKNIGIGTLGDGIISGLSSWKEVCRDCGYQGSSLLFESESEYKKFLDAFSQQKEIEARTEESSEENPEQETDEQIKEKKEILDFLDETEKTPRGSKKRNYVFEFILAVALSIVFFVILFGSKYILANNGIFSQNDLFTILLYLLGSFVGVLIFFFLIIVFVETIYRSIHIKKK